MCAVDVAMFAKRTPTRLGAELTLSDANVVRRECHVRRSPIQAFLTQQIPDALVMTAFVHPIRRPVCPAKL
jgi:hypothetical protein